MDLAVIVSALAVLGGLSAWALTPLRALRRHPAASGSDWASATALAPVIELRATRRRSPSRAA